MKKFLLSVVALLLAVSMLAGCTKTAKTETEPEQETAKTEETAAPAESTETPAETAEPAEEEGQGDVVDEEEESTGMINPWTDYATLADLQEDYPGLEIDELPDGATDVIYRVLEAADYTLFEVQFNLDGGSYTYRIRPSGSTFEDVTEVSGCYGPWDIDEAGTQLLDGVTYPYAKQFSNADLIGNMYLYDPEGCCCYNLTSSGVSLETLAKVAHSIFFSEVQTTVISGSVVAYEDGELKLLTDSLNTLVFHPFLSYDLIRGDYINVTYAGSFATEGEPEVVEIEILEKAATFTGTVTKHDSNSVSVESGSGALINFLLAEQTVITGEDTAIKNGATVVVTYAGDIADYPTAFEVDIIVAGDELDPSLIDKTLTGTVTKLNNKTITILTNKGRTWTFKRTTDTEYPAGKSDLEVNCSVKITYDGYASTKPDAKIIKVLAPAPDPTPEPEPTPEPKIYTVEGTVEEVCGIWILLENDSNIYTVNSSQCEIVGADELMVGSYAKLEYYTQASDCICTYAEFSMRLY